MLKKLIPAILVLALALVACGVSINLPTTVPPGPITTDQISLPLPADTTQTVNMTLTFGAGTLKVHGGTDALVSGTATYNFPDFKPVVTSNAGSVTIEQGNWNLNGIPDLSKIKNEWDLSLGQVPLNLAINGGAYDATYDLGGLALANLTVKDGAAKAKLDFSSPNATQMSLLRYETGASNVSLTGLGNANFSIMEFSSGAGNYTLDFSGALKRDASVHITTGVSNLTLVIPQGIPVQITTEGGLSNVTHDSGWSQNSNVYTQQGNGSQLTFVIEVGAGNLVLTH
jgi:hypothetical protein